MRRRRRCRSGAHRGARGRPVGAEISTNIQAYTQSNSSEVESSAHPPHPTGCAVHGYTRKRFSNSKSTRAARINGIQLTLNHCGGWRRGTTAHRESQTPLHVMCTHASAFGGAWGRSLGPLTFSLSAATVATHSALDCDRVCVCACVGLCVDWNVKHRPAIREHFRRAFQAGQSVKICRLRRLLQISA